MRAAAGAVAVHGENARGGRCSCSMDAIHAVTLASGNSSVSRVRGLGDCLAVKARVRNVVDFGCSLAVIRHRLRLALGEDGRAAAVDTAAEDTAIHGEDSECEEQRREGELRVRSA